MKAIIGLGNPGEKYHQTRHNLGFMFVDYLQSTKNRPAFTMKDKLFAEISQTPDMLLAKPQTFMNDSGRSVQAIKNFYKLSDENILVVHDDLDIGWGEFKFIKGKGPKVHNGLLSIEQSIGTKDFWRLRVGADDRTPEQRAQISGREYVLKKLTQVEIADFTTLATKAIEPVLEVWLKD